MKSSGWNITSEKLYPAGDNPFGNKFYGYTEKGVTVHDGKVGTFFGISVGQCVHIVPIEQDLTVHLVRQARPNAAQVGSLLIPQTLELPGGFVPEDQEPAHAANRELQEEVGRSAGKLTTLGSIYPSPGVSNEVDHLFLGTDLSVVEGAASGEATEADIEVVSMPFGEAYDMFLNSESPVSGQTLAAMARAARYL